jgi:hypothetical protein
MQKKPGAVLRRALFILLNNGRRTWRRPFAVFPASRCRGFGIAVQRTALHKRLVRHTPPVIRLKKSYPIRSSTASQASR